MYIIETEKHTFNNSESIQDRFFLGVSQMMRFKRVKEMEAFKKAFRENW